ncbi:MAG: tungsten cofactor oxidoreductase radical SAM maturase [Candidatus Odinarchaeia archaeon]
MANNVEDKIKSLFNVNGYLFNLKDEYVFKPAIPDLEKIYVELTSRCNFNCTMCIRQNWSKDEEGDMDFEVLKRLIKQMKMFPNIKTIVIGGLGEPTVYPFFPQAVSMLRENFKNTEIHLTTNGALLSQFMSEVLKLDKLIVSLDAVTPQTFEKIRRTTLHTILENLRAIKKIKEERNLKRPQVSVEFVAMKSNLRHLSKLVKEASNLGVSEVIVTNLLPYHHDLEKETLYPSEYDVFSNIAVCADEWYGVRVSLPEENVRTERECPFIINKSCVIGFTGDVFPCYNFAHTYTCYINGREKRVVKYSFGNIEKNSLKEIWCSREYLRFRWNVKMFNFPSCIDCRYNDCCSYVLTSEEDCWGRTPSCADCLWSRKIIRCP